LVVSVAGAEPGADEDTAAAAGAGIGFGTGGITSEPRVPQAPSAMVASKASAE
jgi:hypothetical protein